MSHGMLRAVSYGMLRPVTQQQISSTVGTTDAMWGRTNNCPGRNFETVNFLRHAWCTGGNVPQLERHTRAFGRAPDGHVASSKPRGADLYRLTRNGAETPSDGLPLLCKCYTYTPVRFFYNTQLQDGYYRVGRNKQLIRNYQHRHLVSVAKSLQMRLINGASVWAWPHPIVPYVPCLHIIAHKSHFLTSNKVGSASTLLNRAQHASAR